MGDTPRGWREREREEEEEEEEEERRADKALPSVHSLPKCLQRLPVGVSNLPAGCQGLRFLYHYYCLLGTALDRKLGSEMELELNPAN